MSEGRPTSYAPFTAIDVATGDDVLMVQVCVDGEWMRVGSCGGSGKFDGGWKWLTFETEKERTDWIAAEMAKLEWPQ